MHTVHRVASHSLIAFILELSGNLHPVAEVTLVRLVELDFPLLGGHDRGGSN